MLKKIALGLAAVIIAILLFATTKPDHFEYSSSVTMKAPPAKIFDYVNDLSRFPSWSPFEKLDPNMKKTLSGPTTGEGAISEWEGNTQAGAGRITIVKVTPPSSIQMRLEMFKPMQGDNQVEFTFVPEGEMTKVTWSMRGKNNYVGKLFGVFVDCKNMVEKDFTEGLNKLKSIVESN